MGALGYFGKIPGHGDFIHGGVDETFRERWDEWLSDVIHSSREELGEAWQELYLSMPVWRFMLARGVLGENAWLGLLMPSIDRVGRCFPLTLTWETKSEALIAHALSDADWFERAEQVATSTLDRNISTEHLNADLALLGLPGALFAENQDTDSPDALLCGPGGLGTMLGGKASEATPLAVLGAQLLRDRLGPFSAWWTTGSEAMPASLLACPSLPTARQFCTLISGDSTRFAWTDGPAKPIEQNE